MWEYLYIHFAVILHTVLINTRYMKLRIVNLNKVTDSYFDSGALQNIEFHAPNLKESGIREEKQKI